MFKTPQESLAAAAGHRHTDSFPTLLSLRFIEYLQAGVSLGHLLFEEYIRLGDAIYH